MMRDPAFMESIKNDPIYQKIMVRRRGREGESAGEVSSRGGHTLIILFLQQPPPTTKSEAPKQQHNNNNNNNNNNNDNNDMKLQHHKRRKEARGPVVFVGSQMQRSALSVWAWRIFIPLLPPPSSLLFSFSPLPLLLLLLSIFLFPFTSSDIVV